MEADARDRRLMPSGRTPITFRRVCMQARQGWRAVRFLGLSTRRSCFSSRGNARSAEMNPRLLVLLLLSGCAINPGHVNQSKSVFDGSTEIRISPAWVDNPNYFKIGWRLGAFRSTRMPEGAATLEAFTVSPTAPGKAVSFNFDGQVERLIAIQEEMRSERIGDQLLLGRRFEVKIAFLERLASATNVTARIETTQGYLAGVISSDAPTTFRPALRKLLARLATLSSETSGSPSK